jgi:D-amino peptidase
MNLYIMTDFEGVSGIYDREQVLVSGSRYNESRMLLVRDINACADAAKEAGVEKIFVRDSHGNRGNVIWENLSSSVDYYIIGTNSSDVLMPGLDECDAVILLGFHAMAGTQNGILEHTMSSVSVQNYWINSRKAGEIALEAAIAGDKGKPVIMGSGDDKACGEAKMLMPWIVTAEVKKGLGCYCAMLLPPERSYKLIKEKTKEAITNYANAKPYLIERPVTLRVEYVERTQLPNPVSKPYMKFIDGRTIEVEGSTMEEALFRVV